MVSALGSPMMPYRASTLGMANGIQNTAANALAADNPSSTGLSGFGNAGQVDFSQMFSMFALVMQQFLELLLSMFQGKKDDQGGSGGDTSVTPTGAGGSESQTDTPTRSISSASSPPSDKGDNQTSTDQPGSSTSGPVSNTGGLSKPLNGYTITSRFGSNEGFRNGQAHTGVDMAANAGTEIKAAGGGTVKEVGTDPNKGYGYYVKIDNGNGVETLYAHMQSPPPVQVGQSVNKGQRIGGVGTTGFSTGNHLHFEVRKNGQAVNPQQYVSLA